MSTEKRSRWYDTAINLIAAFLIYGSWKLISWAMTFMPGNTMTADDYFIAIVALTLATHLHERTRS
jgi:MFS superfamily sulfate permease-like transporter